jgi:hypothetical protein
LLERVVSTLSFHVAVGRFLFKLGSAITRYIYVACYIIASTLRVGFLASFSSVSKYSVLSIYRLSREWRKQSMNAGKQEIRKTTFF